MSGNGVLDKNDQSAEESIRANVGPGGSHDDLGKSDEDRQAEVDNLNNDYYSPEASPAEIESGESVGKASGEEPTLSDNAEIQKLENTLYRGEQPKGPFSKLRAANKRRKFMAGLAGGGIVGMIIGGLFLLPLKVMHISENLQDTFFSSSEEAADEISNRLLSSYIIYKVIPGLNGSCPSTKVDKSCAVVDEKDNYVTQLYRAWRDNNLEGKMAEKHGLEIKRENGRYKVLQNGKELFSESVSSRSSNEAEFNRKMNDNLNRKEVRRAVLKAIENETFYKRIMYRYKYGSLMERKYGIVRCVIACEYRNDRADKKELRKLRFKAWVIQRVITPLNEGYGMAFECAVRNFDCVDESKNIVDDDGTKKTEFENNLRERTKSAIGDGRMTEERLAQLQRDADDIRNNGLSNHLLKKVFGEGAGKIAGGTIAGIGIIETLSSLIEGLSKGAEGVQQMNYALKSGTNVQTYSMYRTNADEIKAGSPLLNTEETGYVAESLGDSFGTDQGGGGAEAAPYYNDLFGSQGINTASLSLFPKAEAANPFVCDDGTTILTGLCPEMSMATSTAAAKSIEALGDFFNSIGLTAVAQGWGATGGKIFDGFSWLLDKTGITDVIGAAFNALTPDFVKEKAADIGKNLAEWFAGKLFVNAMTDKASGARMFETAAVGANIAANDYAHYGLGAGKISDQAANDIRYARAIERQEEFARQPFLARMFDTSNSYSMVSRIALATPTGSGTSSSLAATLLSPVKMISSAIPSLSKASAAPKQAIDLAGVSQYGYTGNEDIFKTTDFEGYWDSNNCGDTEQVKQWGESSKLNTTNGSFENDTPYPCKLLDSGISMNGAIFSTEFLSSEELGQTEGNGESTGAGANLIVATYNLPSKSGFDEDDWSKAVTLINDKKMDIIGFQEISSQPHKNNYDYLKKHLPNYRVYPDFKTETNYCVDSHSIFYNSNKFEFIKAEILVYPMYDNNALNCGEGGKLKKGESQAPIIWLKTKADPASNNPGGQTIIVMNTHNAADGFGEITQETAAIRRAQAADLYVAKIEELQNSDPGVPVIFTGDFNEGTGSRNDPKQSNTLNGDQNNLFFCKITNKGLMKITEFPEKDCSKKNRIGGVDYIYVTSAVTVEWNRDIRGRPTSGSDHPKTPIYAKLTIPGSGDGGGSPQPYRNPLISSTAPDPSIIKGEDGKYYLYTTGFQKFVSDNIVDWKKKEDGISWIKGAPNWSEKWAPDIAKVGDTYVLSISGGNGGKRTIGYATSKSAAGPFTYQGELINPKDRGKYGSGFDIDPNIVQTDEGIYLYYGSGRGYIMAAKLTLKDGKLSAARSQKVFTTKEGVGPTLAEGAYVHKKDGWYYMFYSSGTWQPPAGVYGPFTPYRLHVARSKSPTGPFVGKGKPILEGNKAFYSPGHGSVITDGAGTDWKIYMAYPARSTNRAVLIDKITYTNGWPVINGPTSTRQNDGPVAGEGPAGVAGWSWPLKSNVNNGPCYGGSSGHAGMDMNSKTADNPVYAMHSGEVVTVGVDSAAGNYITILADEKVKGKPVYYSYEHLKSGSIKVKKGDKVAGGKQVAIAGLTGRVDVDSSKAHLHIVTATTNELGSYGKLGTTFDPMNILMSAGPAPNGYKCT